MLVLVPLRYLLSNQYFARLVTSYTSSLLAAERHAYFRTFLLASVAGVFSLFPLLYTPYGKESWNHKQLTSHSLGVQQNHSSKLCTPFFGSCSFMRLFPGGYTSTFFYIPSIPYPQQCRIDSPSLSFMSFLMDVKKPTWQASHYYSFSLMHYR